MTAVWEVAQLVAATIGILTVAAFATFLWIVWTDQPGDEWDGQNDPLDDGTWTAADEELAHEVARYKGGDDA